ncbi:MAG: ferrochelatase [Coriobacteriales bacterium]|jgi:ferrochelatase|nr:ferrochelatase [Coriobacteriales bacterium]
MCPQDQNAAGLQAVLLVNTGTPAAPTKAAVVPYLRHFLLDRRIVNLPPLLWRPVLEAFVLRIRPAKTVRIYQSIWTENGSPYTLHSAALEAGLQQQLAGSGIDVCLAQRYGAPSMAALLGQFAAEGHQRLLVIPLYPQSALATTGSVHDELDRQLTRLDYHPELQFIEDYHLHSGYLQAIADSICPHLRTVQGQRPHLVLSFHSIPLKDQRHGDSYATQVAATCLHIAQRLGLAAGEWEYVFQSRFDDTQRWLGPFLEHRVDELLNAGKRNLVIACPGFAVDCTETLYDIQLDLIGAMHSRLRAAGEDSSGLSMKYVPCLNALPAHIAALTDLIRQNLL